MIRESGYYIWLFELVGNNPNYSKLIYHLDTIPYRWIFTLDANRSAGGLNLRSRYSYEASVEEEDVRSGPCTVLEMLVGISEHMVDQIGNDISTWFWVLMNNLKLSQFTDSEYDARRVETIINNWLNHNYQSNGEGSLFPLKNYHGDCRNMEIWVQMNTWISENFPEDDSWLN